MNRLFSSGGQNIEASDSASSNEYSVLISFRINYFDLLAVQGTLKSLLQHHSSKESILRHSAFFKVQLSHTYMTTGKIIALTRWTFVGKVMSLLFNMLSRLGIDFLPRSKRLLISWLQSQSAVISPSFIIIGASLVAQMVKNLPAMQETWVQSPGQEALLEKGLATHSSILAWRIPWTEEPGGL